MQGFIHLLLEAYAGERIGPHALPEIRRLAGVSSPPLSAQFFPDEVTFKLIQAVASLQGIDPGDLLYQFGLYFITTPLMERSFRALFDGQSSAREFITQATSVHRSLTTSFPRASMPEFLYIEHSSDLLEIIYDSPRRFCRFLQGILEGVGARFHEPLEVYEIECQHRGAPACRLAVRFLPVQRSGPLTDHPLRAGAPGSGPAARSGPLPQHPSGPLEPSPHDILGPDPTIKRDQEEDVLVLQALSGQLSAAPRFSEPGAQHPLSLMLSLFEISQHLKASGFSGDHARFSLVQRSLARLTAQGFVETKLDGQPHSAPVGAAQDALAFGGAGVLAAQRYRITSAGQIWLRKMQLQQGY